MLGIGCVTSTCQTRGTQWGWQISMTLMSSGNPLCSQPVGVPGTGPVNHEPKRRESERNIVNQLTK